MTRSALRIMQGGSIVTWRLQNFHLKNTSKKVFSFCGTLSLAKQLKPVRDFYQMKPGDVLDVLIKGGSPGHAVIVVDMAVDRSGRKVFMLAQGFMPAQDIHILKNPKDPAFSPWYAMVNNLLIYTPEWVFETRQLRQW